MAQDIRKLMKDQSGTDSTLREGHKARFEQLLDERLPQENSSHSQGGIYLWMKVAAVFIVAGGIALWAYDNAFAKADSDPTQLVETVTEIKSNPIIEPDILLSALSPEFKKIEDYYLASVNLDIARLEITDDNKELIDAFMKQLSDLDSEYKRLNQEITESGVSEEMVNAMIENLKLRVELMLKLKATLKEMKDKKVLVYPISFTVDNSETQFELSIEYKEIAQEVGISDYRVVKAPNNNPYFIKTIKNIYTKLKSQ